MTDEQNIVIASLKDQALDKEALDNGDGDIFAYDACNLRKAANMIVELEETNASLRKENERIRQTHVTHEAMQAVLDELEQVKKERDVARKIANMVPDMCDGDCSGDISCGIYPCPAYQPPDVLDDGTVIVEGCMVRMWDDEKGMCAENGGKDDAHD